MITFVVFKIVLILTLFRVENVIPCEILRIAPYPTENCCGLLPSSILTGNKPDMGLIKITISFVWNFVTVEILKVIRNAAILHIVF